MNLLEDKIVNLTHFAGCDMAIFQGEKLIGEMGAITWRRENYLRGSLYFVTPVQSCDGPLRIHLRFANEYGECLRFELTNVVLSFPKDYEITKVVSFEANEIRQTKIE